MSSQDTTNSSSGVSKGLDLGVHLIEMKMSTLLKTELVLDNQVLVYSSIDQNTSEFNPPKLLTFLAGDTISPPTLISWPLRDETMLSISRKSLPFPQKKTNCTTRFDSFP